MARKKTATPEELQQIKALFAEHYSLLVVFSYGLTCDWETAEALVQKVFVDILRDPQPFLAAKNPLLRLKKSCQRKYSYGAQKH